MAKQRYPFWGRLGSPALVRYGGAVLCFLGALTIAVIDYQTAKIRHVAGPSDRIVCPPAVVDRVVPNPDKKSTMFHVKHLVEKGDTLASIFACRGFSVQDSHQAIDALKTVFPPKDLKVGLNLDFQLKTTDGRGVDGGQTFLSLTFRPSLEERIILTRSPSGEFQARAESIPLTLVKKAVTGVIRDSLYQDATALGVPVTILHAMFQGFSYDVDFQRSLHPGDRFSLLYEQRVDPETGVGVGGTLLTASLVLKGKDLAIYRFQPKGGAWSFYNDRGESVKKGLLRTPIDGARISSGFGKRRHPVLGYTKHHKGIDFAAPPGTPIMASGDGVIEKLGFWDAYGNYIRIRHNREVATAYAHLSRYAKGLKAGKRVSQGQIIGYVGTTGRSTGPHLHYELLKGGVQINPSSMKMMPTVRLGGADLSRFQSLKKTLLADFNRYAVTDPGQGGQQPSPDPRADGV